MTPGKFDTPLPIFQGTLWEFTFEIIDDVTEEPFDLTGLGPFVLTIKGPCGPILAEVEGVGPYDETGIVSFSIAPEVTATFPAGNVHIGIVDNALTPYLSDTEKVYKFPRTP